MHHGRLILPNAYPVGQELGVAVACRHTAGADRNDPGDGLAADE